MKDRMVFYPSFWWLAFVVFMIGSKANNVPQKAVFSLAFSTLASEALCRLTDKRQ
jgi:hypothetical protein